MCSPPADLSSTVLALEVEALATVRLEELRRWACTLLALSPPSLFSCCWLHLHRKFVCLSLKRNHILIDDSQRVRERMRERMRERNKITCPGDYRNENY